MRNLTFGKSAPDFQPNVYKAFKTCKDFGFKDQITRSCLSIPSNIAEGMEKKSASEQARSIEIAKGSAAEFATQVYIGMDINYIEKSDHILYDVV
ncbi:MAG: four helix bundle protein [Victivallaceae bacterium]|nr:four helix bundle protein [Victivallaceae bacterium]